MEKVIRGKLETGDFQEKTMTFAVEGDMTLVAGDYVIMTQKLYDEIIKDYPWWVDKQKEQ